MKSIKSLIIGLALTPLLINTVQAQTITIGKGTGIVWEGLPYIISGTKPMMASRLFLSYGIVAISKIPGSCQSSSELRSIGGYMALPLGDSGVGLIPRAVVTAAYTRADGTQESLTGNIGLPDTKGFVFPRGENITSSPGKSWCLPPSMTEERNFYKPDGFRTFDVWGTWVMVADGSQKNTEISLPYMEAASLSSDGDGDIYQTILPSNITLRISTLECSVNTPTSINFNNVGRNIQAGTELASLTYPLNTTCGQASNQINANINLQFRAISGLYNNSARRLALSQGGGYITGEISNGVTGSGSCNATTGLPFDNSQVKVGNITASERTKTISNQVTWRLCSGGSSLPSGPVDAAAEMLVTFN